MKTRVVNVRTDQYDVYIGRAGKGKSGYFGNPVIKGKTCPVCKQVHQDNGSTLPCYEKHLIERVMTEQGFAKAVKDLRGKTLGCFCKRKGNEACHGDVLASWAELLTSLAGGLGK